MGMWKKMLAAGAVTAVARRMRSDPPAPGATALADPAAPTEPVDTFVTGPPSPPATGEVLDVALAAGTEVILEVDLRSGSPHAAPELLGPPKLAEFAPPGVDGTVQQELQVEQIRTVWMSRDLRSERPEAVIVETENGFTIGWIRSSQEHFTAEVINGVGEVLGSQSKVLAGRALRCQVELRVEGVWTFHEEIDIRTGAAVGWVPRLVEAQVRLAVPVMATNP